MNKNTRKWTIIIAISITILVFVPNPIGYNRAVLCVENGGNWLSEYNECERISEESCSMMGGTYTDCDSPCRNDPDAVECWAMCVQVCKFG